MSVLQGVQLGELTGAAVNANSIYLSNGDVVIQKASSRAKLTSFMPELLVGNFDRSSINMGSGGIYFVAEGHTQGSSKYHTMQIPFMIDNDTIYVVRQTASDLADWDVLNSNSEGNLQGWRLSVAETTINTTTKVGGIIHGSGFTFSNTLANFGCNWYHVWAFLDSSYNFQGIGLTMRPYARFTGLSGTATVNGSITLTLASGVSTVPGRLFTIGARVCVRTYSISNAPSYSAFETPATNKYRFNWGVVTAIADSTITVQLDKQVTALDGSTLLNDSVASITHGYVEQWDTFRPHVIGTGSQTIYGSHYYSLLGEINIAGNGSSSIMSGYRVDDEYRNINVGTLAGGELEYYDTGTSNSTSRFEYRSDISVADTRYYRSFSRLLPTWADSINLGVYFIPAANVTTAANVQVQGIDRILLVAPRVTSGSYTSGDTFYEEGWITPAGYGQYATLILSAIPGGGTGQVYHAIQGYRVKGGMRL